MGKIFGAFLGCAYIYMDCQYIGNVDAGGDSLQHVVVTYVETGVE